MRFKRDADCNRDRADRVEVRSLASVLDERVRRQWAVTEARALYNWGGVSEVSDTTGMSPNTIRKGLAALATRQAAPDAEVTSRVPRPAVAARD
jgi:hypothetical protein